MSELIQNLTSEKDFYWGHTSVQLVDSRLKELYDRLERDRFLLIYGPPKSGKQTFAYQLIDYWLKQQGREDKYCRVVDCKGDDNLNFPELRRENIWAWEDKGKITPYLCAFLECQAALDGIGSLFSRLITGDAHLRNLRVLLTMKQLSGTEASRLRLFNFAEDNGYTYCWTADKQLVAEILSAAKKTVPDLDDHFAGAFDALTGSANMDLVRQFLDSPPCSLADWVEVHNQSNRISAVILPAPDAPPAPPPSIADTPQPSAIVIASPPATAPESLPGPEPATGPATSLTPERQPAQTLASLLREFTEKESDYLNQICFRRSKKHLRELVVGRSFRGISLPGQFAPPDEKTWREVTASPTGFVLLGDAGFGKTVQLLNEEFTQCWTLSQQLKISASFDPPQDKIALTFYSRAADVAAELEKGKGTLVEAVLRHLHQTGRVPNTLCPWLSAMFLQGRGALILDALDEVSDDAPGPHAPSLRRILLDAVNAHGFTRSACPVIIGARKVGYNFDDLPSLPHWELLPFSDKQLKRAIEKWFPERDWQNQFRDIVHNTPPLESMVCIPVLLMMAAQLYNEAFQAGSHDPNLNFAGRTDFYLRVTDFYRRDWARRMAETGNAPTAAQKDQFLPLLEEVGWSLWRKYPNRPEFSGHEIAETIQTISVPAAFRNRDCYRDVCESGLLAGFESQGGRYEFLHRTLLEFLASSWLARKAQEPGSTLNIWDEMQTASNFADSSVPWMVAGLLENPGPLIDSIEHWAAEGPLQRPSNSSRIEITEPLIDCLYECRAGGIRRESLNFAWDLSARTLDSLQRQRGWKGDEWRELIDPAFSGRVIHAIAKHEGTLAGTEAVRDLLQKLQGLQRGATASLPAEFFRLIRTAVGSECAPLRWMAVWALGALAAKQFDITDAGRSLLKLILERDPSPHVYVRAVAGRALVQSRDPGAFALLAKKLHRPQADTVAAAAIAIGAYSTRQALEVLIDRASAALAEPSTDARNVMLGSMIGAVESVITKMQLTTADRPLQDTLIRALESTSSVARSAAASALGKLHVIRAWPILVRLLSAPRNPATEIERGSLAYGCQQLAPLLTRPDDWAHAIALFRKLLADRTEMPAVRRPAASALGNMLQADPTPNPGLLGLLRREARETRDPEIADSCLFALTRVSRVSAESYLIPLLKEDLDLRFVFCEVVAKHPSTVGLNAILWLLENDKRPAVQRAAFNAIARAVIQASYRSNQFRDRYGSDATLLLDLAKHCVLNIKSGAADSIKASVSALVRLVRLPVLKSNRDFSVLLRSALLAARDLAATGSNAVRESAAFLLEQCASAIGTETTGTTPAGSTVP